LQSSARNDDGWILRVRSLVAGRGDVERCHTGHTGRAAVALIVPTVTISLFGGQIVQFWGIPVMTGFRFVDIDLRCD